LHLLTKHKVAGDFRRLATVGERLASSADNCDANPSRRSIGAPHFFNGISLDFINILLRIMVEQKRAGTTDVALQQESDQLMCREKERKG